MKKLYIILGWGERKTDENYSQLVSACPKYKVKFVKTITRNPELGFGSKPIERILADVDMQAMDADILLGFSAGATLTYLSRVECKKILCSLPPIFGNDNNGEYLTKEQIKFLSKQKYEPIKAKFFYGDKEKELLKRRNKQLGGIEVKGEHKLEGEYLKRIIKELNKKSGA